MLPRLGLLPLFALLLEEDASLLDLLSLAGEEVGRVSLSEEPRAGVREEL